MRMRVSLNEIQDAQMDLMFFMQRLPDTQRRLMHEIARLFYHAVKDYIRSSVPVGRVYGTHRASAPGQPPAIQTKTFINSIYLARAGEGYVVGSTDWRAEIFEEGGLGSANNYIAPRPWLQPVWDEIQPEIDALIDRWEIRYGR